MKGKRFKDSQTINQKNRWNITSAVLFARSLKRISNSVIGPSVPIPLGVVIALPASSSSSLLSCRLIRVDGQEYVIIVPWFERVKPVLDVSARVVPLLAMGVSKRK